jgi:hypothetical protein
MCSHLECTTCARHRRTGLPSRSASTWMAHLGRMYAEAEGMICSLTVVFTHKQTGLLRHDHLWWRMDVSVVSLLISNVCEGVLCCSVEFLSHILFKPSVHCFYCMFICISSCRYTLFLFLFIKLFACLFCHGYLFVYCYDQFISVHIYCYIAWQSDQCFNSFLLHIYSFQFGCLKLCKYSISVFYVLWLSILPVCLRLCVLHRFPLLWDDVLIDTVQE